MRVAISVPTPLYKSAEKAARRLRVSRSQLYAQALRRYLTAHGRARLRGALNRVYRSDSGVPPDIAAAQAEVLGTERW